MAKLNQSGRTMYETPQAVSGNSATEFFGGMAPTKDDIIKSANARAQKRHEMKSQNVADESVLPDSARMTGNEMVGIKDEGYIVKKDLEFGANAMYNSLPPGMDIEDQETSDIRKQKLKTYSGGLGYPDDGWNS